MPSVGCDCMRRPRVGAAENNNSGGRRPSERGLGRCAPGRGAALLLLTREILYQAVKFFWIFDEHEVGSAVCLFEDLGMCPLDLIAHPDL